MISKPYLGIILMLSKEFKDPSVIVKSFQNPIWVLF